MTRTRSRRLAAMRGGLLAGFYLFTVLAPSSAAAADPTQSTPPDAVAGVDEPSASPEPTNEPLQKANVPDASGAAAPTMAPASEQPEPSAAPGHPVRHIITFRPGTTTAARGAALAAVEGTLDTWIPELRIAAVLLRAGSAAADAASLAAHPSVLRVERDGSRDVEAAPDDARYAEQWSLPLIGWDRVATPDLPGAAAIVAILDTGVDADHPDLDGRLLPGASFVDGQPADTDPHGHGTWLAGIVAAATDNGEGIAGIGGSGVRVLPITVLAADGTGDDSAVIAGIVAAVDGGADVILMAFSNPGYSAALQAAVDYAWASDVVLVAANGNDGTTNPSYPAGHRGVMGIASTDRADQLAADSNHGPQTFLAAPGVEILTTAAGADTDPSTDDEYRLVSGTSMAAAAVAASASVLRALDANAPNAVIVGRLARSAAPAGTAEETGNGRLDLGRATADSDSGPVTPAGIAGDADGGPFVGPYVAAAGVFPSTIDVGGCSPAGSSSFSSPTYTEVGCGADIWGGADNFHFDYTSMTGDGQLTARVTSMGSGASAAKAGVMMRETTATNSRHVSMFFKGTSSVEFLYRTTSGGSDGTGTTSVGTVPPHWFRVTRTGNVFTGETAPDVVGLPGAWTLRGTRTMAMNATISVGLATNSHVAGGTFTATYDNVSMTNVAPILVTTGTSLAYTENGTTLIDPGITVADADDPNLASGQVFVNGGYIAGQDVLGFTNQSGITGSYSGGILTMTGSATVAQWQAALRTVTYTNTSDAPSTGNRQIGFQVNDGTVNSNAAFRTITVTAVNDVPVVTATVANLAYIENGTTVVDAGITASDVDSANFSSATVTMTTNYQNGQDTLAFVNANGITGTWTAATGVLALSGSATAANYQAALRSITYNNNSDAPNTLTRTVTFLVNDGAANSNTTSRNITITAVNDAMVVTATGANLAYTENATVALDGGLTVIDPDSANLASATINMTTNYVSGQDALAFVNANGITGTWTVATGVMNLSGSATVANYQTALRSITYTNTSDAPSTSTRTFTVKVNDGTADSNTTSRNITIAAANDAPVNSVPGAQSVLKNQRLMLSGASGTRISTSDLDAAASPVQVQLIVTNGTLSLAAVGGLTFSTGDGTADATMTFSGSLTNVDKALAWVVFDPTTGFVGSGSLQVVTSDLGNSGSGGALTDTDSISIAVRDLGVFTGSIDVVAPTIHTASVTAPANPYGVEINPATNRLYVPGFGSATVSVIDGTTHGTIATIPVGVGPMGLAVNQVTNRIYVPNNGASKNGTTVSVIDGATNTVIATITAGTGPRYAAVNEATNTIYVANNGGATVTVIDGATNTVSGTITLPSAPSGVAVNPVTDRLYVTYGAAAGRLAVYNTTTNALVTTVTVGNTPWAVAVNATTNRIYTTNFGANSMSVIDGASHTVTATVTLGNWVTGIKVDPVADRIYVTEYLADAFVSIDGATNQALARGSTPAGGGPIDLAVNPLTGRVYVATYGTGSLRVFQDGLTFRGTADFSSPTYTVAGSGIGMVSSIDEFQFLYKTMTGDGRLTVRTTGITNTGAGATAGLMMRDTLVSVLPFVMVSNTGAGGGSVQQKSRSTNFGVPTTTTVTGAAVPQYLRITRVGSVFTTEYSADGSAWTQVGTPRTITMSATLYVGLAVTSENVAALNTSTFEAFTQNLAPVAAADPSYTATEDGTLNQPAVGGVLTNDSDPESAPLTAVLVSGTSGLTLNADGSFTYLPPPDFNGVATFTYKANDGALDSNTVTATITVAAVNDAPVITPTVASLAYTENATTALDAGIVVTDVDSSSLTSATVIMTTNYVNGQDTLAFVTQNGITGTWTAATGVLALSGSATTANYQTALRSITYTNSSNAPNTSIRTVTFVASDGSATSTTASRTITVAAVNDGPVNTVPGAQTTVTDLAKIFSSGIGNPISIADADVGTVASVQVQLFATNGTMTLSGVTGLTFSVGDGTADTTMTFTGTLANVNARLAGSRLTPTAGFNGTATLQIVTGDQGNTGSGGPLSDSDSISITVEPIDLGIFTAHQDIGSPGIAGTANQSGGVYTVEGGGLLGGGSTTDQLQFLYRTMTGDGRLTARVTAVENTNTTAKAGVMFRDTLDANSRMTLENIRPTAGNAAVLLWRSTVGGAAGSATDVGIVTPYWVRMTRIGATFKAEYSADGVAWVQQGTTQTITMGATIHVGLAVTAQDNAKLNTSTFDNVSIDLAPTAAADAYSVDEDATLAPPAPGVLINDTDPESGTLTAALVTDVSSGSLTLNADGSFTYAPTADFNGTDSFTYRASDATFASDTVTVTITVDPVADVPGDGSYVSSAGWSSAFDSSRYLDLTFPAYVAVGSVVAGATFRHSYRSAASGDTTCYYFEVYDGGTLLATHGSALVPVSCNSTVLYATDAVSLPEVDSAAKANSLTLRLFIRNSGGNRSAHRLATLGVDSSLD
jgi:YVTN family beta-propeller protein